MCLQAHKLDKKLNGYLRNLMGEPITCFAGLTPCLKLRRQLFFVFYCSMLTTVFDPTVKKQT